MIVKTWKTNGSFAVIVVVTIASVMSAVACRHRSCQLKINAVRDSGSHRSCFFGPQPVDTNNHPRTHTVHYLVACRERCGIILCHAAPIMYSAKVLGSMYAWEQGASF